MRLALAQINPTVGDIAGAAKLVERGIDAARQRGAHLVVFPELCLSGYPPRDLVLQEGFVARCAAEAKRIGETCTTGVTAVIGTPMPVKHGSGVANSLVAYREGVYLGRHDKRLLPTYDVFDEDRYFEPGDRPVVIDVGGLKVGLAVCEDLWKGEDAGFASRYAHEADPVQELVDAGARVVVSPSASPFVLGKGRRHRYLLAWHASRHRVWVASVNQVGGNDDLIFDGHSCVIGPDGQTVAAAAGWREDLVLAEIDPDAVVPTGGAASPLNADPLLAAEDERLVFEALTLGVRDYVRKTGFQKVVIGLSGGIDSALTAAVAVAALGAERVTGASMPGKYSSEHSKTDAHDLARSLGLEMVTMPIADAQRGFAEALNPAFSELGERLLGQTLPDVTEENLQSRIRGALLMALSNRTGSLVLTTGNKSELAVGYCTLYGDMNGGLSVLSDVPKTMVYRLARWINANWASLGYKTAPIPDSSITKPPSAELAPDQKDTDSLPPYDVLDEIVDRHVERRQSAETIIAEARFDEAVVRRICELIDRNEYKRQQAALGLKVTGVAFGRGRRVPIARGRS